MSKAYGVRRPLPPADCGDGPAVYSRTISPSPTQLLQQQKTRRTRAARTHAVHRSMPPSPAPELTSDTGGVDGNVLFNHR